jgi:protein involved in polysaccharide export with SLBB domain
MFKRLLCVTAVIAAGLMVAGCYQDFGPVAAEPAPIPPPAVATELHVGDQVSITVYDEPSLTGVYTVNPAGYLNLPLIGLVNAAGHTPTELERVVTERYASGNFLQQPKVTISTALFQPIYIFGEVEKPGQYPFQAGLNVLTAITTAGGLTYRGSKDKVFIEHAGQLVWSEYPLVSSVTVLPGDVIRVPERYF